MEDLLKSNLVLLYIVLLMSVVMMGVKVTERMRVALVYGFSFCLAIVGALSYKALAVGSTVVLIIALEFINADTMRTLLFTGVVAKARDFLYRLFIELSYLYFVLSMVCLHAANVTLQHHVLPHEGAIKVALLVVGVTAMARAFLLLSSPRYKTADITSIVASLESKPIYEMHITPHIRQLFGILAAIEDRSYFTRPPSQHTIAGRSMIGKVFQYVRTHSLLQNLRAVFSMFNRGYGTIEMQLLRSIGVELGYTSVVRRKLFELCYSGMIFNGYRSYLARNGGDYSPQQYSDFIMYQYLQHAGVKLNDVVYPAKDGPTVLHVFNKQRLSQVSKEEFYVWCLGLPRYDAIGPVAVGMHAGVMHAFAVDQQEVMRIVNALP